MPLLLNQSELKVENYQVTTADCPDLIFATSSSQKSCFDYCLIIKLNGVRVNLRIKTVWPYVKDRASGVESEKVVRAKITQNLF